MESRLKSTNNRYRFFVLKKHLFVYLKRILKKYIIMIKNEMNMLEYDLEGMLMIVDLINMTNIMKI